MFKNYFKIALRHLGKNKGYASINMIGLALGMACAILILLWVNDEIQYNKFHQHYSQLYKVLETQTYDGKKFTFAAMPGGFGPAVKQELPEIKYATRTDWGSRVLFSLGDKSIYEVGHYADPDFLKMFSFPLLKGDINNQLKDPTSVVITDKMAEKFFGTQDAIGKILKVNNDKLVTVTGIVKEPPPNSSLKFAWLANFKIYEDRNEWLKEWGNNGIQTFVELNPGTDVKALDKKFYDFIQKRDTTAVARPFLFAINDWRLRGNFEEGKQVGGRIEYVRLFSLIAILIIVIACINFMNLATARSEQRAREVGVRKVMGAGRGTLIRQFFGESVVMALVAMIMASLIVFAVLPLFNTLVEKKLHFNFSNPVIWGGLPLMAIICGLLAGSYPSLYLSSFNPITVFRGLRIGKNSAIAYVRKGLVITQFVISIVLIISTIIIYRQIQHVKDRPLGYDTERVLYSGLRGNMNDHFNTIRNDLLATGAVENAAAANSRVLDVNSSSGDFSWQGKNPTSQVLITTEWVSSQYISTMKMQIKHGRDFYTDGVSDTSNIIINETFAKIIGRQNPVGEILKRDNEQLQIVGVVKDFIYNDMYRKPEPLILFCQPSSVNLIIVRLKKDTDIKDAVAKVQTVIRKHAPAYPFEYKFMDDEFNSLFKNEMLVGKLSRLFAFLTILISCLGLFGLAAYTAERRTKEIGIRKVLGATVSNVVALLSKDFLRLVGIASVIAFPLAYWAMFNWLQDFAYRVSISWWVFIAAGVLALVIALATVSFQAVKAAIMNPVKSLRTE
ncbi:MAG TPA: ABC transporter permease [Chitinophagaceae bacterium]|nr:ABC transporter permease [Chitinophagaceae bacterium]